MLLLELGDKAGTQPMPAVLHRSERVAADCLLHGAAASLLSWKLMTELTGPGLCTRGAAEVLQCYAEASHGEQKLFCPF